jgi:hypothetical protein
MTLDNGRPRSRRDITARSKRISFLRSDLDAYGDILVAAFPNVRFQELPASAKEASVNPPTLHRRICDCREGMWGVLRLNVVWTSAGEVNGPRAYVYFLPPGRDKRNHQRPWVPECTFDYIGYKDVESEVKILSKAMRLLNKVAWSGKSNLYYVTIPEDAPPQVELREVLDRPKCVLGRDAVAWAREDPERLIGVYMTGTNARAWRPAE